MAAEINRQAIGEVVELLIAFKDYGRIIDQRKIKAASGGEDYLAGLEKWIKEKGFKQKFISGYMRRHKLKKPPANVLNKIAWGIVTKRARGKKRNRRWYNKSKSAAITELFTQVAAGIPAPVADELKKTFK